MENKDRFDLAVSPDKLFKQLDELPARRMDELTAEPGLFLLLDHTGGTRFVGFANSNEGFVGRVNSRHCAGDEGHRYSGYYNVGRMYRQPKTKSQNSDAKTAKALRVAFCREYCKVKILPLDLAVEELKAVCAYIMKHYPESTDWNRASSFAAVNVEPSDEIDRLLIKLNWNDEMINAIQRQKQVWAEEALVNSSRTIL